MRMMVMARMPNEAFNAAVRAGNAGAKTQRILDELKPEAAYFTEMDGQRTAVLIMDVADPTRIPAIAEPWFLTFGARVEFHPVMTPEDLARTGLDELGKKWGG